ncbi:MAG TPA: DUF2490 domain-containing protein [Bacteroidia bacterium]
MIGFLLFASIQLHSQVEYNTGAWAMGFSQVRIHDRISIHLEAQYRDHGIFNEAEQILLRGGLNYHLGAQAIASAGYGRITGYTADGEFMNTPASAENRTWEQFILRNTTGRFIFEHRYRLEQRWIKTNLSNRYMDRVRYCLRMTIPLSRKTLEKNTLFLSFYDEIFINLTAAPFDRNRAYAAIGFQLSPQASVQAGYMAQTLGVYTKQFLQIALFYNPDLRKKK